MSITIIIIETAIILILFTIGVTLGRRNQIDQAFLYLTSYG
ncbi:MAG: hypothetical protein IJV50_01255 [Lachnospiraceae bacterium]|nr:hypothetical protein [Lachnospiraceae bacterium]